MFKGKLVVLSVIAAALLCWQVMPASVNTANSGIVDPCSSSASSAGGCWVVCPEGDAAQLDALAPAAGDATISVTVKDNTGTPIAGIPAADFWLVGVTDNIALCGGAGSINATAGSDANGQTTIIGALAGGGCDDAVYVVVQGAVVDGPDCSAPAPLAILTRSPDTNGDLVVDSLDFTFFGNHWVPFSLPYDKCVDYDCNSSMDSIDFTEFGNHFNHACP
jgi:hypothetical protein